MLRRIVMTLVVLASLAIPAAAAEPFVALVDLERGLLLIPEGTAVPKGVELFIGPEGEHREAMAIDSVPAVAAPRRFVYAYAAAEKFVAARERIVQTEKEWPESLRADDLGPMFVADMDQTYYYYFYDGSWHGARKYIRNISTYDVQFGVATQAYTPAGDYDTKIYITESSSQAVCWNQTKTCWLYGTAGSCTIPICASHQTPTFTGSAKSTASIVQYLYEPCDLPCKRNLYSSIVISFP